jgi:hypothetical protein
MKEVISPRIRLGESVKDKVRSSVWNLVSHSLMSSVHGPIYDLVWRLLVDPVNNSTNFRL